MKCNRCSISILIICIALTANCGSSLAAEFSANEVQRFGNLDGKITKFKSVDIIAFQATTYVKGSSVRRDYFRETKRKPITEKITINLPEKGTMLIISPRQKTFTERRYSNKESNPLKGWQYIDEAKIKGYKCKVYKQSLNIGSRKYSTTMWWSIKLNYGIKTKTISSDGNWTTWELTDITIKKLPNSLFQLPKGYKKLPFKDNKSFLSLPESRIITP